MDYSFITCAYANGIFLWFQFVKWQITEGAYESLGSKNEEVVKAMFSAEEEEIKEVEP